MKLRIDFAPGTKLLKLNKVGESLGSLEVEPAFYDPNSRANAFYMTSEKDNGETVSRAAVGVSGISGALVHKRYGKPCKPKFDEGSSE